VEIEELTGGEVTRKQLRSDDWWQIWPELRGED
jgi:DNA-binding transcriptional regulator YdaS (Cro superfamily)